MNTQVHLLILTYSINFRDADDGDSYAGDGQRVVSAHLGKASAEAIAAELNPVLSLAEKETIVFPRQKHNRIMADRLGFCRFDIADAYAFKLVVQTHDLAP